MAPQNVLITAAAGNIGVELIPLLTSQNPDLKLILPTSNAARLQESLPSAASNANIIPAEGPITDPQWIQSLLTTHAIDTVFLCLTGTDELMTTLNILDSMARVPSVKHLVYLSACGDFISATGLPQLMRHSTSEHVLVKVPIELKLLHGQLPFTWTVIGPTLFFTNDLRSKHALTQQGLFDEPIGNAGVSRVAPGDIALAVRNSIVDQGARFGGKKIMVGSRRLYTGDETAKVWSEALGRPVVARKADREGFDAVEAQFGMYIPRADKKAWARDLRLMYETFAVAEFGMSEEEYREQVELLGKEPEDYEQWVKEVAASWK